MQRAREAAESAAEQARAKATEAAGAASRTAADPATQEKLGQQARAAMGAARRGVSTVVERIDPGVLADLIIKATALQEMTNSSLREKQLAVSHQRDLDRGLDPARGDLRDRSDRRPAGDDDGARAVVRDAGRSADARRGGHLARRHDAQQEQLAEVRNALANEVPEDINRL